MGINRQTKIVILKVFNIIFRKIFDFYNSNMSPKEMFADISSENYPVSAVHPPPSTAAAATTATTDVKKESDEKIKTSAKIVGSLLGLCVMGPLGAALGTMLDGMRWNGRERSEMRLEG